MNTPPEPTITTIDWVNASTVLGHEERGFSAWLADHLDLIADALDLPNLDLIAREERVGEFRADLLCVADDGSDDGLPVVIENQYNKTDHDNLGKIVTYLAGQQRGLGIWIAEHIRDPHVAAVDFLNRTSDESVGYALLRVRFAPGPNGSHYVDFQVMARPNTWLKSVFHAADAAHGGAAPARLQLLSDVWDLIGTALAEQGWRCRLGGDGKYIELNFPLGHPLAETYINIRTRPNAFRLIHVFRGVGTLEESMEAVDRFRQAFGETLSAKVPAETVLDWTPPSRTNAANGYWTASHPDGGYATLDAPTAASWVQSLAATLMATATAAACAHVLEPSSSPA